IRPASRRTQGERKSAMNLRVSGIPGDAVDLCPSLPEHCKAGIHSLFWRSRMKNFRIVIVASLLVAADNPKDDAGKKDLAKLQGTWSYVAFVNPIGAKMPEEHLRKQSITYAGNRWTVKEEDQVIVSGTQKLDPSKTPPAIDSLITEGEGKDTTMLGIY